jgi:hypothetical protein
VISLSLADIAPFGELGGSVEREEYCECVRTVRRRTGLREQEEEKVNGSVALDLFHKQNFSHIVKNSLHSHSSRPCSSAAASTKGASAALIVGLPVPPGIRIYAAGFVVASAKNACMHIYICS